ncbi:MAG: hypothetical protein ABGX07_10430 [Pirellulaceae bacterium]|nr:hypothetical protein [Dehalococcoidia bacterium]HIK96368.1 hypothetical protein [Planctomycetota bacterium]
MPTASATTATPFGAMRGHFRSLLAQFGLTPKSKRGLAHSNPGEAVDPLDALRQIGEESTG